MIKLHTECRYVWYTCLWFHENLDILLLLYFMSSNYCWYCKIILYVWSVRKGGV